MWREEDRRNKSAQSLWLGAFMIAVHCRFGLVRYSIMDQTSAGWGVNAILGDFHKGEGRILLCLPFDARPWGCGSGKDGSWNNSRIQWEVLEPSGHTYAGGTMIGYDAAKNETYFLRMWKMLVAWNVYVAHKLGFGPEGISDHAESYRVGMGSNHADMGQWLPKHGKSMDCLRAEVRDILNNTYEEGNEMTKEEILALVQEEIAKEKKKQYYNTLADIPPWYLPTVQKFMEASALVGRDGGADGKIETIGDNTIQVDETFCRVVVVLDKAGLLNLPTGKEAGKV